MHFLCVAGVFGREHFPCAGPHTETKSPKHAQNIHSECGLRTRNTHTHKRETTWLRLEKPLRIKSILHQ